MHNELEERKKQFLKTQNEKSLYLGEYKERVIAALKKDQILEDDVYQEILDAINSKDAYILKMSRDLELKKLKPYIEEAEKTGLKYQLVDGITYIGDIGLIVAAKDALDEIKDNVVIRDMDQDFIDAGLGEIFSKNRGKKICSDCYEEVEDKLPQYLGEFKKINFLDKLIGVKCPICKIKNKK
ncbi:MAG: hypothetical protein PWP46_1460 [Fusobacteriaceae bacterium]|jgi:uncharacterized protein YueI|nr:hypothetical protein [Fusobacteriaceae bacterium]